MQRVTPPAPTILCHTVLSLQLNQVQCSIGHSDYVARDEALAALIQPLAGEYGMHNSQPQGGLLASIFCMLAFMCVVAATARGNGCKGCLRSALP